MISMISVRIRSVFIPRPKPIHAVREVAVGPATKITSREGESTPIPFKFWAGPESDDDDDDGSPSTAELISEALDAGYLMEDLAKAEKALAERRRALALVADLVHKKMAAVEPWQGPLPARRVSPPRTLGDVLSTTLQKSSSRMRPSRLVRPPSGAIMSSMEENSKSFEPRTTKISRGEIRLT
jgi:hypothetical protein